MPLGRDSTRDGKTVVVGGFLSDLASAVHPGMDGAKRMRTVRRFQSLHEGWRMDDLAGPNSESARSETKESVVLNSGVFVDSRDQYTLVRRYRWSSHEPSSFTSIQRALFKTAKPPAITVLRGCQEQAAAGAFTGGRS